jgi:hypothetical protein
MPDDADGPHKIKVTRELVSFGRDASAREKKKKKKKKGNTNQVESTNASQEKEKHRGTAKKFHGYQTVPRD